MNVLLALLMIWLSVWAFCWYWVNYVVGTSEQSYSDDDLDVVETPPDEIPDSGWNGVVARCRGALSAWHFFRSFDVGVFASGWASVCYLFLGKTGKVRL